MAKYKKHRRRKAATISRIEVGARLAQIRLAYGWRQAHISKLTGISAPSWYKYESGAQLISVHHAVLVMRLTAVTLDWIYLGKVRYLAADLRKQLTRAKANGENGTLPRVYHTRKFHLRPPGRRARPAPAR